MVQTEVFLVSLLFFAACQSGEPPTELVGDPILVIKLDEAGPFPDTNLGGERKEFKGLHLDRESEKLEGWTVYTRSEDSKKFEGIELSSIEYGFWRNRLGLVQIRLVGKDNARMLMTFLRKKYGMCGELAGSACAWQSKTIQMQLKWQPKIAHATWLISSLAVQRSYFDSLPKAVTGQGGKKL